MKVDVLLGLQWGDEGKGKVVDVLTPRYDIITRFQGGPNAGHTLEFKGEKYVLRSIPSGIFQGGKVNIIGNAAAFVAYNFIGQYFFVTKPDYNVAVVAPYYLPEDTVNALQDALAAYGEDRNGDGKVVVTLNVYTLDYSDTETQTESAAYLTMAGTTKLATDVQGGLSSVFLLWDPAGFEESTGSLRYLDGTLPAADSDEDWWNMVYKWDDCPVLAGLDLGDYGPDTTQSRSGSSQEYMSQFYVGMRGAWNSGTADNLAGGEEFWQKLTEGAASTAAPED